MRSIDEAEAKRLIAPWDRDPGRPPRRLAAGRHRCRRRYRRCGRHQGPERRDRPQERERWRISTCATPEVSTSPRAHLWKSFRRGSSSNDDPGTVGELLVGICHDPALGLYLVIGSGGTLVEWFNDRQVLIILETEESIRKAIGRLRAARRLAGDGPGRAGDIDAAVEGILALQRFALAHERQLVELEINLLIVTASKAVAADAILRMYPAEKS
ncbi:MAG: acetate--CoA ligase family protein [Geminicoccaceae bacterium]